MTLFHERTLWRRDDSVIPQIAFGCMTTGTCDDGTWYELDLAMWQEFGRVIYYEATPQSGEDDG